MATLIAVNKMASPSFPNRRRHTHFQDFVVTERVFSLKNTMMRLVQLLFLTNSCTSTVSYGGIVTGAYGLTLSFGRGQSRGGQRRAGSTSRSGRYHAGGNASRTAVMREPSWGATWMCGFGAVTAGSEPGSETKIGRGDIVGRGGSTSSSSSLFSGSGSGRGTKLPAVLANQIKKRSCWWQKKENEIMNQRQAALGNQQEQHLRDQTGGQNIIQQHHPIPPPESGSVVHGGQRSVGGSDTAAGGQLRYTSAPVEVPSVDAINEDGTGPSANRPHTTKQGADSYFSPSSRKALVSTVWGTESAAPGAEKNSKSKSSSDVVGGGSSSSEAHTSSSTAVFGSVSRSRARRNYESPGFEVVRDTVDEDGESFVVENAEEGGVGVEAASSPLTGRLHTVAQQRPETLTMRSFSAGASPAPPPPPMTPLRTPQEPQGGFDDDDEGGEYKNPVYPPPPLPRLKTVFEEKEPEQEQPARASTATSGGGFEEGKRPEAASGGGGPRAAGSLFGALFAPVNLFAPFAPAPSQKENATGQKTEDEKFIEIFKHPAVYGKPRAERPVMGVLEDLFPPHTLRGETVPLFKRGMTTTRDGSAARSGARGGPGSSRSSKDVPPRHPLEDFENEPLKMAEAALWTWHNRPDLAAEALRPGTLARVRAAEEKRSLRRSSSASSGGGAGGGLAVDALGLPSEVDKPPTGETEDPSAVFKRLAETINTVA